MLYAVVVLMGDIEITTLREATVDLLVPRKISLSVTTTKVSIV